MTVGILGHGMSGLSHLSSTLGWNTNRGDGLLANTQGELRGSLGLQTCRCSSLDDQGHLIKTNTHQSHQSQEMRCKLGLRIWRGGTSGRVTWNTGKKKVLPEARMTGGGSVPGSWLPEMQQLRWGGEDHMSAVQIDCWESLSV